MIKIPYFSSNTTGIIKLSHQAHVRTSKFLVMKNFFWSNERVSGLTLKEALPFRMTPGIGASAISVDL